MEVELETLAEEEEEEDTIELGEVQELGTEILEMILEQVFEVKTWSPRAHRGAQLSQAPPEHVDVDRGACEESGAEGQFSEHIQGETHVSTVAEEPNLEILGTWQQHRARSPTLCPFDGPWRAVFIQKQGMAITMMWRE
jgi:hypothetical protein